MQYARHIVELDHTVCEIVCTFFVRLCAMLLGIIQKYLSETMRKIRVLLPEREEHEVAVTSD